MKKKIILAITGASGSLYAVQFLKLMQHLDVEIHGLISDAGRLVLQHELGLTPEDLDQFIVQWHAIDLTQCLLCRVPWERSGQLPTV